MSLSKKEEEKMRNFYNKTIKKYEKVIALGVSEQAKKDGERKIKELELKIDTLEFM